MNSLAKREELPLDVATTSQPSVADMLQAVIKGGVTNDNVGALEKMCDLYERMEQRSAEKAFNAAFVALQRDMPTIVAKSVIPNRGKYERFEDLMETIGPLLTLHGFSVSFSQDFKDSRIVETCHLRHEAGHSQSNSFAVRVGGRADSDTQADCKAATTAKRNALCNALNIVIRQDVLQDETDVRNEGAFITEQQADDLEHRCKMLNLDLPKILASCKVKAFKELTKERYDEFEAWLAKKENPKR